jgi:hypothetical protein
MLDAAIAVFLIFASLWLEAAGVRAELRRPRLRRVAAVKPPAKQAQSVTAVTAEEKKCDIKWHEVA